MRSLAVLLALSTTLPAQIQRIDPNGLAKPTRYAHVVVAKAEKTIYVAGQIGVNASGQLVAKGDLVAQAEQAFSNVETALISEDALIEIEVIAVR